MSAVLTFTDTRYRSTDSDTSKAAANGAVSFKAGYERMQIILAVGRAPGGLTAREAAVITGIDYITVQRRISECGLTKTDQVREGCRVWSANA